jgi:two-component system response regulator GlrR
MKKALGRVAKSMATVLLVGESGTGKSMLATLVHQASPRAAGPFVRLDCTCHGDALIDSLLFGHRRGAFTGAVDQQKGLLEAAQGGTLFIDEISELPLALQGKLLTILEEGTFRIVGATKLSVADVRLIVATNKDLNGLAASGQFRRDLLYRLGELRINIPTLREHIEDVPPLAENLLATLCAQHSVVKRLSPLAIQALASYSWPGNVRQLKKVLERAVVLGESVLISVSDLGVADGGEEQPQRLSDLEREYIVRILGLTAGNKSKAAKLLGLKRSTLYSRLAALGLH